MLIMLIVIEITVGSLLIFHLMNYTISLTVMMAQDGRMYRHWKIPIINISKYQKSSLILIFFLLFAIKSAN